MELSFVRGRGEGNKTRNGGIEGSRGEANRRRIGEWKMKDE
jgi:hypothetical protein